jgi:choline dehydrogenase-like flavoprotein
MSSFGQSGSLMTHGSTAAIERFGPMRRYDNEADVDAVVIGTGAGGAPILARLAAAGMRVVALEAGPCWDPARDFATDEREQAKLFWRHERITGGGDPIAFGANNSGTGVGGSTLHFTAYTPRPHPDDFTIHRDFGVGVDWPFGYDELEPYLTEVEQFLGISGPTPYPWGGHRSKPYALPALPLNGAAQLMARGCDAVGMKWAPAANAAVSGSYYQPGYGWRPACTNRGHCQAGCSTGAKASMDVTFLPLAVSHGAEVRPDCFVVRFEMRGGRVTGVVYKQGGREKRQRCKAVFLCGGGVESPRLLLMNGIGNSSGQVGRNLTAHVGLQMWGQFDEDVRPYKGIPGGLISEDTHRPRDADFAGGYLVQSIGVMPVTYATQLARGKMPMGEELLAHMRRYNHVAGINVCGDCLPGASNFMELSDELDDVGLPKPRVHFTNGEHERRMNAHAGRVMRQIWDAAGAKDVWTFERSAHAMGMCRMGSSAADNVVDPDGRSFDVPNLYVMDNSVFPSALSVNPSLTQMALSLRTADKALSGAAEPRSRRA